MDIACPITVTSAQTTRIRRDQVEANTRDSAICMRSIHQWALTLEVSICMHSISPWFFALVRARGNYKGNGVAQRRRFSPFRRRVMHREVIHAHSALDGNRNGCNVRVNLSASIPCNASLDRLDGPCFLTSIREMLPCAHPWPGWVVTWYCVAHAYPSHSGTWYHI